MNKALTAMLAVAAFMQPAGAFAGSFVGTASLPDGRPAYGAMVTVFDADGQRRQTVYTAADGSYAIRTPYAGKVKVRVSGEVEIADLQKIVDKALAG